MPHCIIEYSRTLEATIAASELMAAVHQAALDSVLFNASHIKTRALAYEHYHLETEQTDFIHVIIRLHTGRTLQQKQLLTTSVLQRLVSLDLANTTTTIETIDIETESYAKQTTKPRS